MTQTLMFSSADYADRARGMGGEEVRAAADRARELFGKFTEIAGEHQRQVVAAVQLAWEIGEMVQIITGHEKVIKDDAARLRGAFGEGAGHEALGARFGGGDAAPPYQGKALEKVGSGAPGLASPSVAFAQACLSLRQLHASAPSSYVLARPIFEALLVQLELFPKPERGEQQAHGREPLADFLTEASRLATHTARLLEEIPVASWPEHYRVSFLRQTKPVVEIYRSLEGNF